MVVRGIASMGVNLLLVMTRERFLKKRDKKKFETTVSLELEHEHFINNFGINAGKYQYAFT